MTPPSCSANALFCKRLMSWLVLPLALSSAPAHALDLPFPVKGEMSGIASVVDGDGLAIAGVEVRLQGIAAPEDNGRRVDPGGKDATSALRQLAEGQRVVCYLDGTTANKRPVGVCYVAGEDVDVGEMMVRDGYARDCPSYSGGRYAAAEGFAVKFGRDLSAIYPLPKYC